MDRLARALAAILATIEETNERHALFGGLAARLYGVERATGDVDLLVAKSAVSQAEIGLVRRGYAVRSSTNSSKVFVPGEPNSVADLLAQETNAVLRAAFALTDSAVVLGQLVSVVKRGVFVALKFEASVTRRRMKDRARDLGDICAVLHTEFGIEDERLAIEIAGKMYPGAVADFESLIDDVRHGRSPRVALRAGRRLLMRRRLIPSARGGPL